MTQILGHLRRPRPSPPSLPTKVLAFGFWREKTRAVSCLVDSHRIIARSSPTIPPNLTCSCAACLLCFLRKRGGVTVTLRMKEDLRQVLSWNAKRCSSALDGGVFEVCMNLCVCVFFFFLSPSVEVAVTIGPRFFYSSEQLERAAGYPMCLRS